MIRYKFESNSQREDVLAVGVENVYAMLRYKFESNSQLYIATAKTERKCVCYD